jgi:hypothetical protein
VALAARAGTRLIRGGWQMAEDGHDPAKPGEGGSTTPAPTPADDAPPAEGLRRYVAQQGGRFTDEALTATLVAAGHGEADVRAALAEYRATQGAGPVRQRAIRAIAIGYLGVYALLSIGMLANGRAPSSNFMPDGRGGIVILTVSLILAFVASMIWVANRRAFGILLFALVTLGSISGVSSYLSYPEFGSPLVFVPPAIGILGLIWLLRRGDPAGRPAVALEVLLSIPIILLVGVAGTCLVSGLPIPGGA